MLRRTLTNDTDALREEYRSVQSVQLDLDTAAVLPFELVDAGDTDEIGQHLHLLLKQLEGVQDRILERNDVDVNNSGDVTVDPGAQFTDGELNDADLSALAVLRTLTNAIADLRSFAESLDKPS